MIADVIVESPLNIYVGVMLTLSLNISGNNWKLREVYDVNIDKTQPYFWALMTRILTKWTNLITHDLLPNIKT